MQWRKLQFGKTQTKGPAFAGLFVDIRLFWRYLEVSLSALMYTSYQITRKKSSTISLLVTGDP